MIKNLVLTGISVVCTTVLYSQGIEQRPDREYLPRFFPSPEAAKLGKYGEVPVGYYNGSARISIPLTDLVSGPISVPVSLDYTSGGGIKISEIANNAGLGWNLSAANVVTRVVQGGPDDQHGFLESAANGYTPDFIDHLASGTEAQHQTHLQALYRIANGCLDFQPDIYYYNFGSYSGKFTFDWEGNLVNLSANPISIAYTTDITGFSQWTITTQVGIKYTFAAPERTVSDDPFTSSWYDFTPCDPTTKDFYSSWYLTKIEDQNGHYINFTYEGYTYLLTGYMSQQVMLIFDNTIQLGGSTCTPDAWAPPNVGIVNNGPNSSKTRNTFNMKRLKSIKTSENAEVVFNYNTIRTDVTGLLGYTNFKSLDNIKLNYQGALVKQWDLVHDYSTGRLTLTQLVEKGSDAVADKKHVFSYNGAIPTSLESFAFDHWGYFNGQTANTTSVPSFAETEYVPSHSNTATFTFNGANREPDPAASQKGLLTKIVYPTGGYSELTYEGHDCGRISNKTVASYNMHPKHWENTFVEAIAVSPGTVLKTDAYSFTLVEPTLVYVEYIAYINASSAPTFKPRMFITKTDGGSSIIREKQFNYSEGTPPVGDFYETELIELLPGTYEIKAEARDFDIPSSTPDKAKLAIRYEAVDTSVTFSKIPVGGARIKKIKNFDNYTGLSKETNFTYGMPGMPAASSGVIHALPVYDYASVSYYSVPLCGTVPQLQVKGLGKKIHSARNVNEMDGDHIGYEWVTITEEGMGKKELHYTTAAQYYDDIDINYPFMPPGNSQSFKRGLLIDENDFTLSGSSYTLAKTTSSAFDFINRSFEVPGVFFEGQGDDNLPYGKKIGLYYDISYNLYYSNVFKFDKYYLNLGYPRLISTTETQYLPEAITTTTANTYHATMKQLVKDQSVTNSDGKVTKVSYTYASDEPTGSVRTAMLDRNMISVALSTKTFVNNVLKATEKNTYALFNTSQVLPQKKERAFEANPLEAEVTFNKYDTKGNLLSYTTIGNATTTILWGYNGAYPVAEITNIDTAALATYLAANPDVQTTFNAPSSDAALRTKIQQLRTAFAGAMITGYTYKPMVGITSKTDVNNIITYYEYDPLGRLQSLKDNNGKILQRYNYKIQGTE